MEFTKEVFNTGVIKIPESAQIVFVADLFDTDYVGGAELTTKSLIESSPYEVFKLHSKDVTLNLLKQGNDKFWIFGNFAQLNPQLIPSIIGNLNYSIVEYDYKYCKFRSPEKHFDTTKVQCDCHNQVNGKLVSAFFYGAKHLWWMSEKQKEKYHTLFPFLAEKNNTVLSSVFDNETLFFVKELRLKTKQTKRNGWLILDSQSWIKGTDAALKWCKDKNIVPEIIQNWPYEKVLRRLSTAEGLIYLPLGGDTCPRIVIEARLLGCKLIINDNVQHMNEVWFV